jgi:hypothetical protein
MRLRPLLALLLVLAAAAPAFPSVVTFAHAQDAVEMPPMPRPRPDPASLPSTPALPGSDQAPANPAADAIAALTSVPQPVTLTVRLTQDAAPIVDGVDWRIFEAQPDTSGEMALVAKSELGEPTLELPPGDYVVHVSYGRAQAGGMLKVAEGPNQQSFVLDAGALRLNSAVTGDIAIPVGLLKFDIFTSGEENDRELVVGDLQPNDIVTLNAGTYHIVSYFGSTNAVVRADLRVEAGQLADATLYHHASQIGFKLVSETGGEAIADVEWTVKTADGATIFSELGAFPSTVLAEGDYLVFAKQGTQVFNREFQVQAGSAREIEVLTTVY